MWVGEAEDITLDDDMCGLLADAADIKEVRERLWARDVRGKRLLRPQTRNTSREWDHFVQSRNTEVLSRKRALRRHTRIWAGADLSRPMPVEQRVRAQKHQW